MATGRHRDKATAKQSRHPQRLAGLFVASTFTTFCLVCCVFFPNFAAKGARRQRTAKELTE